MDMWIIYATGSALFAGMTSVLAKCGVEKTDSTVATAIRTVVVLAFAWLIVFLTEAQDGMGRIDATSLIFLILSGLSTGFSWICYFRALQLGSINKVVPVDKSSIILAIVLSIIVFGEKVNIATIIGIVGIALGTLLMIDRTEEEPDSNSRKWLIFAFLSALFAALTSVFGKLGMDAIDSNLGTALRTIVVLVLAWGIVFAQGNAKAVRRIDRKELVFICLSGVSTGASWLCFFHALQTGSASLVIPIDKLSILVSIAFGAIVFKERLSVRAAIGLALIVAGTLAMFL